MQLASPVTKLFRSNDLLAALPRAEHKRLLGSLEPVMLTCGDVLHEPGVPIRYAYFPIDCVVSLLMDVPGHHPLEVALVGHEGMVGAPLVLGIDSSSRRALVQVSGTALRTNAGLLRKLMQKSKALEQTLYHYKHALIGQVAQFAVCNKFHGVQARLARYLLMTSDRTRSVGFRITQTCLADIQGVRRSGITHAAGALRKRGLIDYSRGKITILDRMRLRAASCPCYQINKRIYDSAFVKL